MHPKLIWSALLVVSIFWEVVNANIKRYRFQLDLGKDKIYCPDTNYTCDDNSVHYLCKVRSIQYIYIISVLLEFYNN